MRQEQTAGVHTWSGLCWAVLHCEMQGYSRRNTEFIMRSTQHVRLGTQLPRHGTVTR